MDHQTPSTAGSPAGSGAAHLRAAAAAPDGPDASAHVGWSGLVARVKSLLAWWQRSRAGRANSRFGAAGGGLLTGGIAYAALFAVFSALTLGWSVFMLVLGRNKAVHDQVIGTVANTLPGLIDTGDGKGVIKPDQLRLSAGLSVAGIIALVTLVLSALSSVGALQTSVRAMFGRMQQGSTLSNKLRELGGFAAMSLAVLVSAVLGLALTSAADWLLGAIGWGAVARLAGRVLGIAVTFVVDAATFVVVVKVLAGESPARKDLLGGAAIAGVGLGVVRVLGTSVVSGSVRHNPVLASFAVIVVLLLWINLVSRIVLLAAAWTANPPLTRPEPTPAPQGAKVDSEG